MLGENLGLLLYEGVLVLKENMKKKVSKTWYKESSSIVYWYTRIHLDRTNTEVKECVFSQHLMQFQNCDGYA